jgi:trehalose 6-phosphate phosphatase
VRIEDKGVIVAFHWRGASDEEAAKAAVDALAARAEGAGFTTHWGRKVLEVRPPVRFDKGVGIEAFLKGADVDMALYIGDDTTDIDAFRALSRLLESRQLERAIKVGVASDEAPAEVTGEADVVVDGTGGVVDLLAALVAA